MTIIIDVGFAMYCIGGKTSWKCFHITGMLVAPCFQCILTDKRCPGNCPWLYFIQKISRSFPDQLEFL